MQKKHDALREKGFTLLELTVAAAVFALLAVSVAATLGASLRVTSVTTERDKAREAARAQIEEVLAWPDFATLGPRFHERKFSAGALRALDGAEPPGIVWIDDTQPELPVATARVDWIGTFGSESVELRTFVARRGAP